MEKTAVTAKPPVHMGSGSRTKGDVKKAIFVRFSILLAFVIFLTAMALHWAGYNGALGSERRVYRVNIPKGEITIEEKLVPAQK